MKKVAELTNQLNCPSISSTLIFLVNGGIISCSLCIIFNRPILHFSIEFVSCIFSYGSRYVHIPLGPNHIFPVIWVTFNSEVYLKLSCCRKKIQTLVTHMIGECWTECTKEDIYCNCRIEPSFELQTMPGKTFRLVVNHKATRTVPNVEVL